MALAGEKRLIPEDFSAEKGSRCANVMLTICFVPDVSKVMHHPASITMNDFGDCYDRAAHTIQSIALRAHGIPKPAVNMMLLSLETMIFF